MRYTVIAKGMPIDQAESECRKAGARDIRVARSLGQLFCDLDDAQAATLGNLPGLVLSPIGKVSIPRTGGL